MQAAQPLLKKRRHFPPGTREKVMVTDLRRQSGCCENVYDSMTISGSLASCFLHNSATLKGLTSQTGSKTCGTTCCGLQLNVMTLCDPQKFKQVVLLRLLHALSDSCNTEFGRVDLSDSMRCSFPIPCMPITARNIYITLGKLFLIMAQGCLA